MRRKPNANMKIMKPCRPRTMHMAVNPSITSGLAMGCSFNRSCSRFWASPAWPYSTTRVDSSLQSASALRPESTGRRAPATAAATKTKVAKMSTAGEPPSL